MDQRISELRATVSLRKCYLRTLLCPEDNDARASEASLALLGECSERTMCVRSVPRVNNWSPSYSTKRWLGFSRQSPGSSRNLYPLRRQGVWPYYCPLGANQQALSGPHVAPWQRVLGRIARHRLGRQLCALARPTRNVSCKSPGSGKSLWETLRQPVAASRSGA